MGKKLNWKQKKAIWKNLIVEATPYIPDRPCCQNLIRKIVAAEEARAKILKKAVDRFIVSKDSKSMSIYLKNLGPYLYHAAALHEIRTNTIPFLKGILEGRDKRVWVWKPVKKRLDKKRPNQ